MHEHELHNHEQQQACARVTRGKFARSILSLRAYAIKVQKSQAESLQKKLDQSQ